MEALPVSHKSFLPFGKYFAREARLPDSSDLLSAYWHDTHGGLFLSPDITIGYLTVRKQPAEPKVMERHVLYGEVFAATAGEGTIPVCLPSDIPRRCEIQYFTVRPGDAFMIRAGVWHIPPVPIDGFDAVDFLMVLPRQILSDIDKALVEG